MSDKRPSGREPSDAESSEALARLSERLERAQSQRRAEAADGGGSDEGRAALAVGLRIGVEFVVAIVVATGLGWAIDRVLGTRPIAIIVLFFLGIATGMLNVYRAISGLGGAVGYRRRNAPEDRSEGGR